MTSQGLLGAGQGSQGVSQGYQGAQEGLSNGSSTGMQRAADGGMTPAPASQTNTQRKTMGLFSLLAPLASFIPGVGPLIGGALSAVGGMQAQNQANKAAQAAQGAQGNALAGASGIAGQLSGPPDYSGIVKAEQSGINSLKSGVGGVANPNAVVGQMAGNNIGQAIEGANANQSANLKSAAGIEQGNASQYNQIGTQAGAAAQAQGNPFSLFSNALSGAGGLGGILGGLSGGGGSSAGGLGGSFTPAAGTGTSLPAGLSGLSNDTSGTLPPAPIGTGFGK
jgi:hypothetical protein